MTKLFILGSGFSRAVSQEMPTVAGLGEHVAERVLRDLAGPREEYRRLLFRQEGPTGFEDLLTYVHQDMPWRGPEERHLLRSDYYRLAAGVAEHLTACESKAFRRTTPSWARDFVTYLHKSSVDLGAPRTVVSFNYDTVVERLAHVLRGPDEQAPRAHPVDTFLYVEEELHWEGVWRDLRSESPGAAFLCERLPEAAQRFLEAPDFAEPSDDIKRSIVSSLNTVLGGQLIFTAERFAQYGRDAGLDRLLSRGPQVEDSVFVNRRLTDRILTAGSVNARRIDTSNLYRMPLDNLVHRTTGTLSGPIDDTFQLLKLHGSVNWYTSGDETSPGETVFFTPIDSGLPETDYESMRNHLEINRLGLAPLVVPPVAEKSGFYYNQLIRSMWGIYRSELQHAQEIYSLGYSLPETDLTIRLFLRGTPLAEGVTVFVVNSAEGPAREQLARSYSTAFGDVKFDWTYCGEDGIARMVDALMAAE